MMALDAMHQLHRLAIRGNDIKPAPRRHAIGRQSEHAISNRVAMVVVVKQPGFMAAVAQSSLNFREVHASSIVNDRAKTKAATDLHGLAPIYSIFVCDESVFIRVNPWLRLLLLSTRARSAAGNVSHAVRSTSRGVRSRIVMRYATVGSGFALAASRSSQPSPFCTRSSLLANRSSVIACMCSKFLCRRAL